MMHKSLMGRGESSISKDEMVGCVVLPKNAYEALMANQATTPLTTPKETPEEASKALPEPSFHQWWSDDGHYYSDPYDAAQAAWNFLCRNA